MTPPIQYIPPNVNFLNNITRILVTKTVTILNHLDNLTKLNCFP